MVRSTTAALGLLVGLLVAGPAYAGGGHLAPVQERYEPGEVATLVGYTGDPVLTAVPEEPFYAYLRPTGEGGGARLLRSDVYVGELAVEETPHRGYLRFRVSTSFTVPASLEPGHYDVVYCTDPCTPTLLGDLVDGQLSVGMEPARRVVRYWAPDEPEIANLAADSVVVGPGFSTTAAALRTTAAPPPPPAPVAESPTITVAAPAPPPAARAEEEMSWPLPTALVVVAGAGTGLVLSRRQRPVRYAGVPGV